jgi:hypothetical protein
MIDNFEKQFDPTLQLDNPTNNFWVIHIHNKTETYHLTRQVLLDSRLEQDTYCFFYHILSKDVKEFNEMYGSFACLVPKYNNYAEADLYLNVDSKALECIITYVQTGKISYPQIYAGGYGDVNEIIDLATMFAMPNLVSTLRNIQPSEEMHNSYIELLKESVLRFVQAHKTNVDNNSDTVEYATKINNFIDENKQTFINIYKDNYYKFGPMINEMIKNYFVTKTDK